MIEEDRPSGADAEHCQGAKTINHSGQKRLRAEKRRRLLAKKFGEAEVTKKIILNILTKNKNVKDEFANMTESGLVSGASIACFLELTVAKLKDLSTLKGLRDLSSRRPCSPLQLLRSTKLNSKLRQQNQLRTTATASVRVMSGWHGSCGRLKLCSRLLRCLLSLLASHCLNLQ